MVSVLVDVALKLKKFMPSPRNVALPEQVNVLGVDGAVQVPLFVTVFLSAKVRLNSPMSSVVLTAIVISPVI